MSGLVFAAEKTHWKEFPLSEIVTAGLYRVHNQQNHVKAVEILQVPAQDGHGLICMVIEPCFCLEGKTKSSLLSRQHLNQV